MERKIHESKQTEIIKRILLGHKQFWLSPKTIDLLSRYNQQKSYMYFLLNNHLGLTESEIKKELIQISFDIKNIQKLLAYNLHNDINL